MSPISSSKFRAYVDLARAGNLPSVASNVVAALVLSAAGHAWPAAGGLAGAVIGGWLVYAGGATLNDVFDAAFDARHRPERAIPRGLVSRGAAAWIGALEMIAGAAVFVVSGASAAWVGALLATIVAYDWVHKRWAGAVVLMAGCRVLLALTVATLPGREFSGVLVAWVSVLFVYIVVLSWVARREYRVAPASSRQFEWHRLPADDLRLEAAATGRQDAGVTRGPSVARLLAFIPLIDAVALLLVGAWGAAMACAAAVPLGRWAQRLAAST